VHPDDRQATIDAAKDLRAGNTVLRFLNRYRCKDGTYKWLSWMAIPVFDDQLIITSARDVTEQLRSQEILQESEMRYRSVVASLDEGILVLDTAGNIHACNARAERILGLSADEIVGRTSADPRWVTVYEDGSPFPTEAYPVTVTLRTGQRCSNVVMGVRKPDGSLNWISINSEPLLRADGKTVYGVLATFADITELKQTKELLSEAQAEIQKLKRQRGASSR